ncbi:hypothetical protein, partial [Varibaculum cambriense]|uniref:hypothetical protein n=1 Tax=Varibaculum cambriense TaxID=184870 RepID=UPI002911F350
MGFFEQAKAPLAVRSGLPLKTPKYTTPNGAGKPATRDAARRNPRSTIAALNGRYWAGFTPLTRLR